MPFLLLCQGLRLGNGFLLGGSGALLVADEVKSEGAAGLGHGAQVDGVAAQQGLLVLDALGFRLLLVLVLLAQSCIDRAKDWLHLLQTAKNYFKCLCR